MIKLRRQHNTKWTQKNILTEASLFRSVRLWEAASPNSVKAAKKRGLYTACCELITNRHYDLIISRYSIEHGKNVDEILAATKVGHRISGKRAKGQREGWDTLKIIESTIKYESFKAWKTRETKAYMAAKKRGLIPVVAKLFPSGEAHNPIRYEDLNDEALLRAAIATGAKTWGSLRKESKSLHSALRDRVLNTGLTTKFGLPRGRKQSRKWDTAAVNSAAKTCPTLKTMRKRYPGAVAAAIRLGILDHIRAVYFTQTKAGAMLSLTDCMESAESYGTFSEWLEGDRQAAIRATLRGWLKACTYHFE